MFASVLPYTSYLSISLKQQFAYRVANWAGLFTNAFFLVFRASIFEAAYQGRGVVAGFSGAEAVTYATVTQSLLMVAPQWGRSEVGEAIRSGQIANEMFRPVSWIGMHLSRRFGISLYYVLMRMLPILGLGALLGILIAPARSDVLPFTLSITFAALIANATLTLVGLTAFWMESEEGPYRVVLALGALLSGLIIPISYFPDWAESFLHYLPFQYTLYVPARIYLGHYQGEALAGALAAQASWAFGLMLLAEFGFRWGTKKLVIHGG